MEIQPAPILWSPKSQLIGWFEQERGSTVQHKEDVWGGGIRHKVNKWANLKRQTVAAVDSFHYLNTWFHFAKKFFRYYVFCPQHDQEQPTLLVVPHIFMPSKSQYTTTICTTNIPDMLSMTSLFLIIHLTLQVTSQVLMQFQPVCHLTDYCTEMYSLVLCSVFTGQNNTKY